MSMNPIFLPESIMIFHENLIQVTHSHLNVTDGKFLRTKAMIDRQLFSRSSHLPTIMLVKASSVGPSAKWDSAVVYTWYSDSFERFEAVDCTDCIASAEQLASKWRNSVTWVDFNVPVWKRTTKLGPLTLTKTEHEMCTPEGLNIAGFALDNTNSTDTVGTGYTNLGLGRSPGMTMVYGGSNLEYFASLENVELGLVTSDGLHLPSTTIKFHPFLQY